MNKKHSMEEMRKRYESEIKAFAPLTIQNLVCRDCKYAYKEDNRVSVCMKYSIQKPGKVIYGGDCEEHKVGKRIEE